MEATSPVPQSCTLSSNLVITAWTVLISTLPDIFLREVAGLNLGWLLWAKVGLLLAMLLLSLAWEQVRPLRTYFFILAVLYLLEYASGWVGGTAAWQSWFGNGTGPFKQTMLSTQLLRVGAALAMVLILLVLKRKPGAFFLVKGNMQATAAPIPLLMKNPASWERLGVILAVCISGGTLLFLIVAGAPSLAVLAAATALFPFVVLFAVMNSFSEELLYRASLLSTLEGPIGNRHSLLITAAFFGIGHFYGVPYGIVGVLMAGFLGWLLGKSMLETRGFAWAWIIHFLQDVLIFTFMVIGSVTAGGR